MRFRNAALVLAVLSCLGPGLRAQSEVRMWEEPLVLPTYAVDPPETLPIFFGGRNTQGAQGPIYPYPFIDRLTDRRVDRAYRAVYLENRFVKICVVPELGGRIFSAVDKTDGYDFLYRQHVVKPALIGLLGAWISGGAEWNIPHHHRASTFMEVDHALVREPDGSATVWVGETEVRHRMRWAVGLTLHPDASILEVTMTVANRTPLAHSMLAWANVAINANPDYQVIFPPDVELATFHAKDQFARWPVATEVFNRQDYRRGVDASLWKSHVTPTSFFAWEARGDFLAGYDHGKDAGVAFAADHLFVPGKKLWTWGTGNEGKVWERILTETDGPYAELMIGAFSDNQPDYSWIQPGEARTVRQTWYPLRGLGGVKAANGEAACNMTLRPGGRVRIAFQSTRDREGVKVELKGPAGVLFEDVLAAGPGKPYVEEAALPTGTQEAGLALEFRSAEGRSLVSYRAPAKRGGPFPPVVSPPSPPKDVPTIEELYLIGLRAQQFYSPNVDPLPYYQEALRRDPGDHRVNTAMALTYLKRAMYREAEASARRAVERVTRDHTRPKDGEAYYYLGLAEKALGRTEDAEEDLGRAAWSSAWRSASLRELAELAALRGDLDKALARTDAALETNAVDGRLVGLRCALLRRMGRTEEAGAEVRRRLVRDPLDIWAAHEAFLLAAAGGSGEDAGRASDRLAGLMRGSAANGFELAADYGACGMWREAAAAIDRVLPGPPKLRDGSSALLLYARAYYKEKDGDEAGAAADLAEAAMTPFEYGFPFQSECIDILRWAQGRAPGDGRAPYYLGNFLYDLQPDAALAEWTKAVTRDGANPVAFRNIGLATARLKGDAAAAIAAYERSLALDPRRARAYFELDRLYEAAGVPLAKRRDRLRRNHDVVRTCDDALTREIQVLMASGELDAAIGILSTHHFHVWEGGGSIHDVFVEARLMRGRRSLESGGARRAMTDFEAALTYPSNLEVPEPSAGGGSPEVHYLIGLAQEALGDREKSRAAFEKATTYPAAGSEQAYYRALSLKKLARDAEALALADGLAGFAASRLEEGLSGESPKGVLERHSAASKAADAHYLVGLARLIQGRKDDADVELGTAVRMDPGLLGAAEVLRSLRHRN